jgi:hypothetical protein
MDGTLEIVAAAPSLVTKQQVEVRRSRNEGKLEG